MRGPLQYTRECQVRAGFLILGVSAAMASASFAAAQSSTSTNPLWNGWARCDLAVSGAGYGDRQTHLWIIAPVPPTVQGAIHVHAATWSVSGAGSLQRSQGTQTLNAQWTTQAQGVSAPIAFTVRASDGHLLIKPWHAQLRARGGVSGVQQLTIDGKQQPPATIGLEAFEFTFPSLDVASTVNSIAGSSTPPVIGSIAPMQPAGARATASCSWQLTRGTLAGSQSAQTAAVTSTPPSATGPLTAATTGTGIIPAPTTTTSGTSTPAPTSSTFVTATLQAGGNGSILLKSPPVFCPPASPKPSPAPITSMPTMSTLLSIPLSQPAPTNQPAAPASCTSGVSQQLTALEDWATTSVQQLLNGLSQVLASRRSSAANAVYSPTSCVQDAADADQAFTALMLTVQAKFDELRLSPMTPQDVALVDKEEQATMDALTKQRDATLKAILQKC